MPGDTASLVYSIAAATGWSEDYIYFRMPFARVLQYHHCEMWGHPSLWTVSREAPAAGSRATAPAISSQALQAVLAADDDIDLSL